MRHKVLLIPHGDGGYAADVPSLPGCVTEGDSFDDALAMAREAAALRLASAVAHDMDIPGEGEGSVVAEVDVLAPALAAR
ncbi:MAG: type II toxin-antitoxin system HicB family antitoxin [Thermomicrobiales bacterium]